MTDYDLVMQHLDKQPLLKKAMIESFSDTEFDEVNPHPPTAFEVRQTVKQLEKIVRGEIASVGDLYFTVKSITLTSSAIVRALWQEWDAKSIREIA